jgi:hypothetical protein
MSSFPEWRFIEAIPDQLFPNGRQYGNYAVVDDLQFYSQP